VLLWCLPFQPSGAAKYAAAHPRNADAERPQRWKLRIFANVLARFGLVVVEG
jgi:hypothetical protein